jgi:hypothetical protein
VSSTFETGNVKVIDHLDAMDHQDTMDQQDTMDHLDTIDHLDTVSEFSNEELDLQSSDDDDVILHNEDTCDAPNAPKDNHFHREAPYSRYDFGNYQFEDATPIYESSSVTRGVDLCLVLAFYLRHSHRKCALQYILSLINYLIPDCLPPSKYHIETYMLNSKATTSKHFIATVAKVQSMKKIPSAPFTRLLSTKR